MKLSPGEGKTTNPAASYYATPEEISEARDLYGSTEIEIDDNAGASRADGGLWVAAWVWLDRPDEEEWCDSPART